MNNRQKNYIYLSFVALLMVIAVLVYYSHNSHEDTIIEEAKIDSTALTIAVVPSMECLPFYVADKCGISDSLGLSLRVVPFSSSMDADTAFVNHHVDGIASDMVKLSIYQSNGDSVTGIIGGNWDLSLITSRQSRISDIKGLKEKVISSTRNSVLDLFNDKIISSNPKDTLVINTPQINSLNIRYNMVRQNQVDGGILPEPYSSLCLSKGCHLIIKSKDIQEMSGMFVLIFNDSVISHKEDEIKKLIKVYNASVDFINYHKKDYHKRFMSLFDININIPDSIVEIPKFAYASAPSDTALNTAHQWASGRKLLGKKTKSNIINKDYVLFSDSIFNRVNQ